MSLITGSGAGKLLLFGEHAAVYGYPALGMGLPWQTTVSFREHDGREWVLPELLPEEAAGLRQLIELAGQIFPPFKRLRGMELDIHSDIPIRMGFGSSAALCVAFVKAVVTLVGRKVLPEKIVGKLAGSIDLAWRLANRAERLFHGKPSGIDTGLALSGNVQSFEFTGKDLPRSHPLRSEGFWLVLGAVPRHGTTAGLVGRINQQWERGEKDVRIGMETLGELAKDATALLQSAGGFSEEQLGYLADLAQQELCELGLSTPLVDSALAAGKENGALGGKLSGAGGGGAFYLVVPDRESAFNAAAAVRAVLQQAKPQNNWPVEVIRHCNGRSVVES